MPTTPEHGLSVRDALSPLFAGYYCCCPRISILSLINRSKERKDCLSSQLPHCFSCFLCQLVDQRYRCSVRVMTHSIVLNLILILACNHSVLVFTGLTDCNCMPQRERERERVAWRFDLPSSLLLAVLSSIARFNPRHGIPHASRQWSSKQHRKLRVEMQPLPFTFMCSKVRSHGIAWQRHKSGIDGTWKQTERGRERERQIHHRQACFRVTGMDS